MAGSASSEAIPTLPPPRPLAPAKSICRGVSSLPGLIDSPRMRFGAARRDLFECFVGYAATLKKVRRSGGAASSLPEGTWIGRAPGVSNMPPSSATRRAPCSIVSRRIILSL